MADRQRALYELIFTSQGQDIVNLFQDITTALVKRKHKVCPIINKLLYKLCSFIYVLVY